MESFKTIYDVLKFAIDSEQSAVDFYTELANQSENKEIKKTFLDFANEERGHKSKLQRFNESGKMAISDKKVMDLKISDYIIDVEPSSKMTFQEALVLAMKREKSAFRLYTNLAYLTTNDDVKALFSTLAQEEAKHKLRFEIEYDEMILTEN